MRRGGGERRLGGMARRWDGGAEIKNGGCGNYSKLAMIRSAR